MKYKKTRFTLETFDPSTLSFKKNIEVIKYTLEVKKELEDALEKYRKEGLN